jgi:enoyl-CoA hydratase/carnithine racemase
MATETIKLEYQDNICTLFLNRPQASNSMDENMAGDFQKALEEIKEDPKIKALIVTGAGTAFCAGADLKMLSTWITANPPREEKEVFDFYQCFLGITELEIPTIAALNGPAIGAGGCLALACDMRIAAQEAKLGFTFIKLGINPGMGSEYFLSRLVGPARTLELLMTGDILTAEEALQIGLVNRVVPSKDLQEYVKKFAGRIAAMPASPVSVIKESTYTAMGSTLTDVLRKEAAYQVKFFQTDNPHEGIRAIQEKRAPRFHDES